MLIKHICTVQQKNVWRGANAVKCTSGLRKFSFRQNYVFEFDDPYLYTQFLD